MSDSNYKKLEDKYKEISLLYETMGILHWDKSTVMPEKSINGRTDQLTNLYVLSHKMLKNKDFFNCFKKLEKKNKLNIWEKRNVKLIKREYILNNSLDKKLLEKISKATSKCEMQWRVSKENNDFNSIIPYLEKVVSLRRAEAKIKSKVLKCSLYDALLNDHESDLNSDKIDNVFDELILFLPDFLKEVLIFQKKRKINYINENINSKIQEKLGRLLMKKIGFDFSLGRLDVSMHPFCGGAYNDARITTRYNSKNFIESLMGVLHETGHALYNLGLPEKWKYQPVGDALGTVVHESQSLFMEMQICRSFEFLKFASPIIRKIFKKKSKAWEADNLYRIYTNVRPSFIRVDADEVTYPLHVIIRYKIEKKLIEGDLKVKEIPKVWNMYMKKFLGIIPKKHKDGCLQDIHWFDGTFGYFPTYTLGAIYAAQLFNKAKNQMPTLNKQISKGNFSNLIKWLRKNVHQNGSLYNSEDLIKKITGEELNIEYFKKHLVKRYLN
tara:strand:- start:4771 stop:6261 length:1491 start_codon:yes stop_codon:yes gene_type:complete